MPPVPPINFFGSRQLKVGLIEKVCRLKGMSGPFAAHVVPGEAAQFGLNQLEKTRLGCLVARAPTMKQLGYLATIGFRTGHHGSLQVILLQVTPGQGSITGPSGPSVSWVGSPFGAAVEGA